MCRIETQKPAFLQVFGFNRHLFGQPGPPPAIPPYIRVALQVPVKVKVSGSTKMFRLYVPLHRLLE